MKKVAVLNDLSGLGKCSLTAAIPVLSVMGVQACPLPTAVLSAQTGFSSYYYDDYTRHIEEIIREWKKMDFCPDGIYTGFLAGDIQAERVLDFVKEFQQKDTKVLVDPVLGDNGEEYPMYTESLCGRMRCLAKRASLITPNLTEALLLLYGRDKMHEIWTELVKTVRNRTQESVEIAASALGLLFSFVPGATPKKPFSGLTAHSLPSLPTRIHAMSSPTHSTL